MKTIINSILALILLFALNTFVVAGDQDWVRINSGTNGELLEAIQFTNATTGYIVGTTGTLLKTTDGGNTWIQKNTGLTSELSCLYFFDSQTGIAAGEFGRVIRTTNGGANWTQLASPTGNALYAVHFINSTTGFLVGNGCVTLRTQDAGQTWTKMGTTEQGAYWDCYFFSATEGIVISSNLAIRRTTNSGVNWTEVFVPPASLRQISFINATTGFIVGQNGLIVKTTNSGNNWTIIQNVGTGYSMSGLCFSGSIGYAVGSKSINNKGVIVRTTDSGNSWVVDSSANLPALYDVTINNSYIWALGDSSTIYRSTNPIGIQNISSEVPSGYSLKQNYPNPFNPTTNIEFSIPERGMVQLTVFDITGRTVATLVNEVLSVGSYKYDFAAGSLSSGVYFYRLQTNKFVEVKKMTLVK